MSDTPTLLPLLTYEEAPDGSRSILEPMKNQIPNLYAALAHSPGLLSTYRHGYELFRKDSGFDATEQEIVFLAVSRYHDCRYCQAAHSAIAASNKVDPAVVAAVVGNQPLESEKWEALRQLTTDIVDSRGWPSREILEGFLAAGYTERQVLEIVLAIAVKTISNYTNHLIHTPIDPRFASFAPAEA